MSGYTVIPYTHPLIRDILGLPSPSRLFDDDDDFLPPTLYQGFYVRPPRRQMCRQQSAGLSNVKTDGDKFQVTVDVSQFSPDEISVKTADNWVVVHGKHEEKQDEHGFVSREFTRRYLLPEGVQAESVTCSLSQDGVLAVEAPRKARELKDHERVVPIARVEATPPKVDVDQSAAADSNK